MGLYVARIDIGTSRLAFLQYGMELAYNIIMVSLKSFDLQAVVFLLCLIDSLMSHLLRRFSKTSEC